VRLTITKAPIHSSARWVCLAVRSAEEREISAAAARAQRTEGKEIVSAKIAANDAGGGAVRRIRRSRT
jgi:hypothetical protein